MIRRIMSCSLMTRSAGMEVLMRAADADALLAWHNWVSPGESG